MLSIGYLGVELDLGRAESFSCGGVSCGYEDRCLNVRTPEQPEYKGIIQKPILVAVHLLIRKKGKPQNNT